MAEIFHILRQIHLVSLSFRFITLSERQRDNPRNRNNSPHLPQRRPKSFPLPRRWWPQFLWWCDAKGIYMSIDLFKTTFNGEYYSNLLRQLQKFIKTKQPGKLKKEVLLHLENNPAHRALVSMSAKRHCLWTSCTPSLFLWFDYQLFISMKKTIAWEQVIQWWWCYLCCWWLFWPDEQSSLNSYMSVYVKTNNAFINEKRWH